MTRRYTLRPVIQCPATGKRKFTEAQARAEADRLSNVAQPTRFYRCPSCDGWHVARVKEPRPRGPSTFVSGDDTPRTLGSVARIVPATPQVQENPPTQDA